MNRFQNTGEIQAIKHMERQCATTIQDLDIALCATKRPRIISAEIKEKLGY